MARKRLNKKVAIIGAILFFLLVMAVIGLLFYKSRNPAPFIADGDKAMEVKNYERAIKSYVRAGGLAKADSLKKDILYKLANAYFQIKDWSRILGSWEGIIQIEPANVQIRLEKLRYFYELADSGAVAYWQEVETQVNDFLSKVDNKVLTENPAKWKSIVTQDKPLTKRIDTFLYFLRARTLLERTRSRQEIANEQSFAKAKQDLQKALELEPNNVNIYSLLAQTVILEGRELSVKGGSSLREKGQKDAIELLKRCVALSPDDPKAHQNLLGLRLIIADQNSVEDVKKLEPDYLALVQKFPNDAASYAALTNIYLLLSPQEIDKAAQAAERTLQLDTGNFRYTQTAAIVYLYEFTIHNRQSPALYAKSLETAKRASMMTEAQDLPGPRHWEYFNNRRVIYEFLADRFIEQVLYPFEPVSDQKKQQLIKDAEDAVYQIQNVLGSGDNPSVVKWRGLIEIAKGNTEAGVRMLNTLYEQSVAASGQLAGLDPIIPYALAKVYENTSEQGAVFDFLTSAISSGIARFSMPEALLEFCQTALNLELWKTAVDNIDVYERFFGGNQKSHSLKILGLIGAGDFRTSRKTSRRGNSR